MYLSHEESHIDLVIGVFARLLPSGDVIIHLASRKAGAEKWDYEPAGYAFTGQFIDVRANIDREAIMPKVIESMRKEIQTIRADAEINASRVESAIQDLLSITHVPTVAGEDNDTPF